MPTTSLVNADASIDADAWWQRGVIYQVYPRSFQDSDGDGIGDLEGIRQRLDYLCWLGIDAIWISPIYPSPMADFGYDVADYCNIDARFGTLADFDRLAADCHARGLALILDFVPNHTSDQHPWFVQSRRGRDDPKRDWYLWQDPAADGGPPNNWQSQFGGSAWQFDAASGQYYLHMFLKEQPDLNWRNPEVRAAMYEVMRFWLRRGVDGFRVDVIYHLIKDAALRDNPPDPYFDPAGDEAHRQLPLYTVDQPEVLDVVMEMRRVLDEFSTARASRVLIGEIYLPIARLTAYYGVDQDGVLRGAQLPFNFHLISTRFQADAIDRLVRDYEQALPRGAAPNWVLGNHDKPRIASRVGKRAARLAALLLLTLRGTPTLYCGDELGMTDVVIPPAEVQDPFEKNQPGKGLGRDPQRTPMQWSGEPHAGFSSSRPWLRLADDWRAVNVELQRRDPGSMLALYRDLLALRRKWPALHRGGFQALGVQGDLLAYARTDGDRRLVMLLNFAPMPLPVPDLWLTPGGTCLLSTIGARSGMRVTPGLSLMGFEGVVFRPDPEPG